MGLETALHLLFVCTGNICRSPMAERLAVAYASYESIANFSASSAGVRAVVGHPMQNDAALVLRSLGGDDNHFVARQFTPRIASDADLVITMTRAHRDRVLEGAPRLLRKTLTLPEVASLATEHGAQNFDDLIALRPRLDIYSLPEIVDPIGQSVDVFEAVGSQIAELLVPVIELCRRSAVSVDV